MVVVLRSRSLGNPPVSESGPSKQIAPCDKTFSVGTIPKVGEVYRVRVRRNEMLIS